MARSSAPPLESDATIIAHISDPHVNSEAAVELGRADSGAMLETAFVAMRRVGVPITAILITGDLSRDHGDPEDYARLGEALQSAPAPVLMLPGNHDDRSVLHYSFMDHPWDLEAGGLALDQLVEGPGGAMRILGLDTLVEGHVGGGLSVRMVDWAARRLADQPETPTLLALHHPPFPISDLKADGMGLDPESAAALEEVVRRHPQVVRVLSGHVHRHVTACWAGSIAMTCPSTAWQFGAHPGASGPFWLTKEPGGMLLHVLLKGGVVTTLHYAIT
jgi:3',5'-cyclic-AMP phosphodiesterase